jgi:aminomethyltransferase
MDPDLRRTPLDEWHRGHAARMVPFAGWAMPVWYTSIIEEHLATRSAVGITDISHMGRLRFEGPGAAVFLAELLTRRVADMELGQIRYSLVTNDQGGILDDVLVGYYHSAHGQPFYLVVVNAGNRQKIVDWVLAHLPPERAEAPGKEIIFTDVSRLWAMFAVQGPRSIEVLQPLFDVDLRWMRYYRGAQVQILHPAARRQGGIISRTGYTGEDGFELSIGSDIAAGVWEAILDQGRPLGMVPAGLGARDTLRLEAGMPLYNHELDEQTNPFEAGLGFACHLVGYDFPGRDALLRIQKGPLRRVRAGLELSGQRVARQGYAILQGGQAAGQVTSGTFSPTLHKPIAMGYVRPQAAEPGTPLEVDIRGRLEAARIVELPFYHRDAGR